MALRQETVPKHTYEPGSTELVLRSSGSGPRNMLPRMPKHFSVAIDVLDGQGVAGVDAIRDIRISDCADWGLERHSSDGYSTKCDQTPVARYEKIARDSSPFCAWNRRSRLSAVHGRRYGTPRCRETGSGLRGIGKPGCKASAIGFRAGTAYPQTATHPASPSRKRPRASRFFHHPKRSPCTLSKRRI